MRLSRLICYSLAGCIFTNAAAARTHGTKSKKKPPVSEEDAAPTPAPTAKQDEDASESPAAPNATLSPESLIEFSGELPRVKKLIESALALTTQNLTYRYGSDDPANSGMDCSGFLSYVLRENGFSDVPRDASEQYIWLRKAGTFRAVLGQKSDTFELDDLRPGDLLFWTGSYATDHDPAVTHVMIYLGTEKETQGRVMVGSSDGRSYHGKSRWGVSVFDFQMNGKSREPESKPNRATFVGYARPPGLRD